MLIKNELLRKIKLDFMGRKLKEDLSIPKNMGHWEVELNRRIAVCPIPDYENLIFIIGEKYIYHNSSLVDKNYTIYSYTLEGIYETQLDPKALGVRFFKNLKYIENEIVS